MRLSALCWLNWVITERQSSLKFARVNCTWREWMDARCVPQRDAGMWINWCICYAARWKYWKCRDKCVPKRIAWFEWRNSVFTIVSSVLAGWSKIEANLIMITRMLPMPWCGIRSWGSNKTSKNTHSVTKWKAVKLALQQSKTNQVMRWNCWRTNEDNAQSNGATHYTRSQPSASVFERSARARADAANWLSRYERADKSQK